MMFEVISTRIIEVKEDLSQAHFSEKLMASIWLTLPFIFLIERSPADIGLSLVVLLFLYRSATTYDWNWMRIGWWKICLIFSLTTIFAGLTSELPALATFEALVWLRFPLFALASSYILARYTKVSTLMYLSCCISLTALCAILAGEIVYNYSHWAESSRGFGARLSWPYGDPVPGNYLAKFGLSCFLVTLARIAALGNLTGLWETPEKLKHLFVCLLFVFSIILFTILTGERMNALIILCSFTLASLILFRKNKEHQVFFVLAAGIILAFAFYINPYLYVKFTSNFIVNISNLSASGYWQLWTTGLNAFISSPWNGIGPGNFRHLCSELPNIFSIAQRCDNHPHNFLVQMLAETGAMGTLCYISLCIALILKLFRNRARSAYHSVLFIVPLALFFPIKSNADFFGQWNNLMLWFGIAMSLNLCEQREIFWQTITNHEKA